jgi:hypothetical protein
VGCLKVSPEQSSSVVQYGLPRGKRNFREPSHEVLAGAECDPSQFPNIVNVAVAVRSVECRIRYKKDIQKQTLGSNRIVDCYTTS